MALIASLVPDKTGRRRRKWLAFIVIYLDWSPRKIYRRYRRRFGIGCSYRSLRCARARTSSRNPVLRFFLVAVALVLVNTWIWLRFYNKRDLPTTPLPMLVRPVSRCRRG